MPSQAPSRARSKSILVVEDTETSAEPLIRLLTYAGHRVAWARHGQEALAMLDAARPDVVLLDLMMPVMDGYAFLENLRALPDWRDLPVLVLSAMGPMADSARLHRLGVERVLVKGAVDYHVLLHDLE